MLQGRTQAQEKNSWHGHLAHAWQPMNMGWKPMPRYFGGRSRLTVSLFFLSCALSGFGSMCRIRPHPGGIRRGSICRWYRFVEQAEIDGHLGPVVRGMQNPSPEDPDAFPLDIEKTDPLEPPFLIPGSQEAQSRQGQLNHAHRIGRRPLSVRKYLRCCGLGESEEFAEETPLR